MSWQDCAAKVEAGDPDRFLAAMTASVAGRARLFPLYAFNLEVAKAPWVTSEPGLAEIRLQWWRDALAEIYDGKPVRRHEVVEPLAEVIREASLPRPLFDALIDARGFDIYAEPHAGRASFDAYLAATSGNLMHLGVRALVPEGETGGAVARFGWAVGAANLIRSLPALYASGRNPVPVEGALDRNAVVEGRVPAPLAEALQGIAAEALSRLAEARKTRMPGEALPALRTGAGAAQVLRQVAARPEDALNLPGPSEFRRKSRMLALSLAGRW